MLRDTFEVVLDPAGLDALPLRSAPHTPARSSLLGLFALTALAAVVLVPQIALAGYALLTPDIRQSILDQPVAAAQLAIALTFWIALFSWPLKRLLNRITRRRDVEIAQDCVVVRDQHIFGHKEWSAPLRSYRGVAHHIRSSLAGTSHELVLVHSDPAKTVVLMTAPQITDADTSRLTALLGLPQVAPSEIYWASSGKNPSPHPLSVAPAPA